MQIQFKVHLYRHELRVYTTMVDTSGKPPSKIVYEDGIYNLYSTYRDEAKYLLSCVPDPECVFCHQLESKATTKCPATPGGEHDFDDIPF